MVKNLPLPRMDKNPRLRVRLLRYCRLQPGEVWIDPLGRHHIGCLNATSCEDAERLMAGQKATLALQDPPYNLVAFEQKTLDQYLAWCQEWLCTTERSLRDDASLYVWLGAIKMPTFNRCRISCC